MSRAVDVIENTVHTDGSGLGNEISTLVSTISLQGANGIISGTVIVNGSNQPEVNGLVIGANGNNTTKGFNNFNQSFTNQAYTSALPDGDSWLYCDNTGTLGVSQSLPQFDGKDATNYPNSDYYDLSTNEWKNSSDVVYANGRSYLAKIVGVSSGVPTSIDQLDYTPLGVINNFGGGLPPNSHQTYTSLFATTSTSYIDITSFSVNITPNSSSSKLLILGSVNYSNSTTTQNTYFRLMRDSTSIGNGADDVCFGGRMGTTSGVQTGSINYIDSPNTTSQITYKFQIRVDGGTGRVNERGSTGQDYSSHITVIELGA
jgi:hypothetical protein